MAFTVFKPSPDNSSQVIEKQVLIKGGAQLPDTQTWNLETPLGVVTRVTDDEIAILEKDLAFLHYLKTGYMRIEKTRRDIDKVVGSMELPTSKEGAPLSETEIESIQVPDGMEIKVNDKKAKKKW